MDNGNHERSTGPRTAKILGLFMAAVLAAGSGGCTSPLQSRHVHVDRNNDGYCDEDGQPMNSAGGGHGGSHYYGRRSYPTTTGTHTAPSSSGGISSGTSAPKGGIGSLFSGSGG